MLHKLNGLLSQRRKLWCSESNCTATMSIFVKSILVLVCFATAIQGRNLQNKGIDCGSGRKERDVAQPGKDTVTCNICLFMGYNVDKIEDLTFDELLDALTQSCLKEPSAGLQQLCLAFAREKLDEIYMYLGTHINSARGGCISVKDMCNTLGACSSTL